MKQKQKNVDVEALRTELAEQREAEERAKRTRAEQIADYLCQRINQRRFRVVTNEYRLEAEYHRVNGVAISFWYFGEHDIKEIVNQIMVERGFNGILWNPGELFFRVVVVVITGHGQPY